MFRLRVFPAGDGDCLILSWGDAAPYRHILVDGGRQSAYQTLRPVLSEIAEAGEVIELLVLTHIDADHIEGLLAMAADPDLPLAPKQVWYNGFEQLAALEAMGERQADLYSVQLAHLGWPLNLETAGSAVMIETIAEPIDISGLKLTLLSPDRTKLALLHQRWSAWRSAEAARASAREIAAVEGVEAMGRAPMPVVLDVDVLAAPTHIDPEPPNGSSIAFIAEWQGRRILMGGDAHPDLLARSLSTLGEDPVAIDLFKVSHHGSHGNCTRELVERLNCRRHVISTNGSRHGHPDPQAIARLLKYGPAGPKELHFNYRTGRTTPWNDAALKALHDYETYFPEDSAVLEIDI
jgi:beta-lactamase superfamily II metal-dependent hydrolase